MRPAIERALRAAAFALVAWAIWRVTLASSSTRTLALGGADIERAWPALLDGTHRAAHLQLSGTLPSDSTRDLLSALRRAGTMVTWSSPPIAPLALSVERLREPEQALLIRTLGTGAIALRDSVSPLDSITDGSRGATVIAAAPDGPVQAAGRSGIARAVPPPVSPLRTVLVLGRASWETKFTVAALEEQGWTVEARIPVAPTALVTTGTRQPLDTAHYAAVVALDSAATEIAPTIVSFVRAGGGLVLFGDAARLGAFREIAPATPGLSELSAKRSFDASQPLASLALSPLVGLRGDAVALDSRGTAVAVAARRERAGRVLMLGYEESWHWRLEGGDDAVSAHRRWWSRNVGAVAAGGADGAYAPEGAPVAKWIDALGAPSTEAPAGAPADPLPQWLLPVLCIILLAEWGSRRLRGAR